MKIKSKFMAAAVGVALLAGSAVAEPVIGVTWYGQSGMAKRILGGMQERNEELGNPVTFKLDTEKADKAAAKATIEGFIADGVAGVAALRSTGGVLMKEMNISVPGFIGASNNPEQLGSVENMASPEGMITGVTYYLPHDTQMATFQNILPEMQNILLVTDANHPAGAVDRDGVMSYCEANGLNCKHVAVETKDQVVPTIQEHEGSVDAVILGNQAKVFEDTAKVVNATDLPVLSFSAKAVKEGALAAFAANDHKLGRYLTDSIVSVVVDGQSVGDVPVKTDEDPILSVNMTTAGELGVEVPYEILTTANIVE